MFLHVGRWVAAVLMLGSAMPAFAQHSGGSLFGGGGSSFGGGSWGGSYSGGGYSRGYSSGSYLGGGSLANYRGSGYLGTGYNPAGYPYPFGGFGLPPGVGNGMGYNYGGYYSPYGGYGASYPYLSPNASYRPLGLRSLYRDSGGAISPSLAAPVSGAILGGPAIASSTPVTAATTPGKPLPATVTVIVPADAQVWFNGQEIKTTGESRVFTSTALSPGQPVQLVVKARWGGNTRELQLPLQAGDKMSVDLRGQ